MRASQIEAWVLRIIERVEQGVPIEDSQVEIKGIWIDAYKAARRIAAHANAAFGEPILWVIGLDEDNGVIGADARDFQLWFGEVERHFEGISPQVQELVVPYKDKNIVGLVFDTSRAPFIIKNPDFGKINGVAIQYEVPWRDGTRTRSAKRLDLIKILVPISSLPIIEVLGGEAHANVRERVHKVSGNQESVKNLDWGINAKIYITPPNYDRIVLPFHKGHLTFSVEEQVPETEIKSIFLMHPRRLSPEGSTALSYTVSSTETEAIIDGPGLLNLHCSCQTRFYPLNRSTNFKAKLFLSPAGSDLGVTIPLKFFPTIRDRETSFYWQHMTNENED